MVDIAGPPGKASSQDMLEISSDVSMESSIHSEIDTALALDLHCMSEFNNCVS